MMLDYYQNKACGLKEIFVHIKNVKHGLDNLKGKEYFKERMVKKHELNKLYNQLIENDITSSIAFIEIKNAKYVFADDFRSYWTEERQDTVIDRTLLTLINDFKIIPDIDQPYISSLPKYSFAIQFNFKLATPYISKDDNDFYIIENPVKKDKVFNVPMVSPSTWKGQLRWTIRKIREYTDNCTNDNPQIIRLFGNERETEDSKCGRLIFYPTFLNKVSVDVINPHDRETKAGSNPIYIEVVPYDAKGTFTILYIPFGRADCDKSTILDDMNVVVNGVKEMMLTYGFSAKKTNGCGLIQQIDLQGKLIFNELIEDEINVKEKIQEKLGNLIFPNKLTNEDLDQYGNFISYDKNERASWSSNKNRKYQEKKRTWEEYINNKKGLGNRLNELKNTLPKIVIEPFINFEELENKLSKFRSING